MPSLNDRRRLVAIATICAGLAWGAPAFAAERLLVLEVVINGHHEGRVAEFIDRDGALFFHATDLDELGLVLPAAISASAEPVPFTALPNLRIHVDEATQTLQIATSDSALKPTRLGGAPRAKLAPLTKAQWGALLNYDSAITYSDHRASGGALVDLRLFGPYGVVESSALINISPAPGQPAVVRLDTTYTVTDVDKMRRWRVGDVVTGALPWTRAVRLGGVQVASDFGLRPDLVTFPLPSISGSAAVPSTVNVVVNGVRELSEKVAAGPFAINSLPVVSGAGEVSVTVLDAIGRPTLLTLPFYATTALLRRGLAAYSLEVGMVREDYALASDHYSGWAASQSSRFGVSDALTLESHAEASGGLAMAGVGAAFLVGTFGIANVAVAASTGNGTSGAMISGGFQRVSRRLNFGVSGSHSSDGFRDLAALHGSPVPTTTLDANLGYQMGKWGSLGVAYNRRISRAEQPASGPRPDDREVELVTGSYNVAIGAANFHATGFKDLRDRHAYGVGAGVSFPLGRAGYASLDGASEAGSAKFSAGLVRSARQEGDFGYRLRVAEGRVSQRSAEGEYVASWARLTAGVDLFSGQLAARVGARGALVLAGGELFASETIDDSFAVVSTGDIAGIPVMYENRLVGRSNRHGKLLLPSLRSLQDNRLSIDSTLVPADVEVARTEITVRPQDHSGVAVDFGVRPVNAALITLRDAAGAPVPLGSVVKREGARDEPVGHDGAAYLTHLAATNQLEVVFPTGVRCSVTFPYLPVDGDIPSIGPLSCR